MLIPKGGFTFKSRRQKFELGYMPRREKMGGAKLPEPWLRGTLTEIPAVARAVLHALQLAQEDLLAWCGGLSDEELNAHPGGITPVAFHLRHISRSTDRLLTYAEGRLLDAKQIADLNTELSPPGTKSELFAELSSACKSSADRIRRLASTDLEAVRGVGSRQLPTTVGGLLVHVADHTQRHVGQVITTSKILVAQRCKEI
jgi:uncharacterized damage-inducible protein DinB